MTDEIKSLAKTFTEKEDTEKFLSNLEKLKADGSLTPEMYSDMKAEYEQRFRTLINQVEQTKSEMMKHLEACNSELETYHQELKKLDVKHKVGELSADVYRSSAQKIQTDINRLNAQRKQLIVSINAKSSADIAVLTEKTYSYTLPPPPPARETTPTAPAAVRKPDGRSPKKKRQLIIGVAAAVMVCILLAVFFLVPRGTEEIAIPVEIENAANIGSIYFELTYDAGSLTVLGVNEVVSGGNALLEYNSDSPGRILVAMISSSGITGDVPIVMARFQSQGRVQELYSFDIENAVAYDGNSLSKLSLSTSSGDFTPKDKSFSPPKLVITAQGK